MDWGSKSFVRGNQLARNRQDALVRDLVGEAVEQLFAKDGFLLEANAAERTIAARLAVYRPRSSSGTLELLVSRMRYSNGPGSPKASTSSMTRPQSGLYWPTGVSTLNQLGSFTNKRTSFLFFSFSTNFFSVSDWTTIWA